jgi:hypothetical protein
LVVASRNFEGKGSQIGLLSDRVFLFVTMMEKEVINPIHPEYLPRLSETFVKLYNENAAIRLASHQVPIEEVSPLQTSTNITNESREQIQQSIPSHTAPLPLQK